MEPTKTTEVKKKAALQAELRDKTTGYILTALGLVAGLAWNDAISSVIKYFFPADTNGLMIKFIYAVVVTIAVVVLSRSLMKVLGPRE